MAIIEAHELAFAYPGDRLLIAGLDVAVEQGQMVAICGASGCGKSTLLFMLGLFLRPNAGRIIIHGRDAGLLGDDARSLLRAHEIGFVFQDALLHPRMTLLRNVAEGALYGGASISTAEREAARLMERHGIGALADKRPTQLSGGELQRAALCRALVRRPSIVLADEPTGNLDPANAKAVVDALRTAAEEGAAVIVVTHNPDVAQGCERTQYLT